METIFNAISRDNRMKFGMRNGMKDQNALYFTILNGNKTKLIINLNSMDLLDFSIVKFDNNFNKKVLVEEKGFYVDQINEILSSMYEQVNQ